MKEKETLHSFINSAEDKVWLQRTKTRLCENSDVDECLYKWSLQKRSERLPVNRIILKAQRVQFNKLLGGDETFKASSRVVIAVEGSSWDVNLALKVNLYLVTVKQLNSFLKL
jgi:hypothetical protein